MSKWEFLKENYIDKGLKIFPVIPNGKTPMIDKWQEECSSDYFQVLYWYEQCPECNWALPCTPNDIFVLDLDRHDPNKDGVENFAKLIEKLLLKPLKFKKIINLKSFFVALLIRVILKKKVIKI